MALRWVGVLILLLGSPIVRAGDHLPFRFKAPPDWSSFIAPSIDAAWTPQTQKDSKSKSITLMVHTQRNSRPFSFKGAHRDRLIELVQKTRGQLLRLSGLTDWTIDESQIDEVSSGNALRVRMRGHYRGVMDQAVEFFEWGYFIGDRYYQFSYHQPPSAETPTGKTPDGARLLNAAEAARLLGSFTPEGL
jgi:hypothetical protein